MAIGPHVYDSWNITKQKNIERIKGHSSNQMGKITIGTNNPSHEDWFPKMLFWPCHLPWMTIDGS
jgi:hypothetical protein